MSTIVFAQLVAHTYLPCLALSLAAALAWRRFERGALRTGLQIGAALMFFVPQLLSLFLAQYSVALLAYQRLTLAFWGYGMTALLICRLWAGRPSDLRGAKGTTGYGPTSRWSTSKVALVLCFAVALSGYASWYLVGDYLLPHRAIEGYVERAVYHRGSRSPGWYELFISGKGYAVTRDVLTSLHPGETIRAEVGAGSGTILSYALLRKHKL